MWAFFGGMFRGDPPQMEVADVSVISEAQFAAMMQPQDAVPPVSEPAALPEPAESDAASAPVVEDEQPEIVQPPLPVLPEPDIAEPLPEPPAPDPVPELNAPDVAARPVPRPAPRVAPEAVPEPEPEAEVAPDVQETVEQSDAAEPTDTEEQQATAPEAATTEIVTEAENPARAPTASLRPQTRPNRPAPTPEPAPTQTAETQTPTPTPQDDVADANADAIASALEEALSGSATTGATDGPPLTQGERDGFRIAVQDCWVVDVGSQSANVTVTVGFDLDRSGRVSSLRMLSADGGTGAAVDSAFQAARRAILRCQGDGYVLPADKYEQWKSVEMTFNPESMRIR